MRRIAMLAALFVAAPAWADAPALKLPAEVSGTPGQFIVVTAETEGKVVRWVPLDTGLSMIPVGLLKDSKTAVLMAPKGRYRLLAFTAAGDEPSEPAVTVIVVDGAPPKPPDETPPTQPPVETPKPTGQIWAFVVQPDGPLSPALAANRKDPAWQQVRDKGVKLSWLEQSAVDPSYAPDLKGLTLPALLVIRIKADGKAQLVSKQTLPGAADAVRIVMEAVK